MRKKKKEKSIKSPERNANGEIIRMKDEQIRVLQDQNRKLLDTIHEVFFFKPSCF